MKYIEGNVKRHQKKWNNLCFESGSLRISKRQSDWRKVSRVLATWYSVLVSNIWWKHEAAYWHCFCFTSVRQGIFVMIRRLQMTNRGSIFFNDKSIFEESCFHSLAAKWYDVRLVVALVKQGSALSARGWVTARLISRWHLSGLVAVASNACEVTLEIDFHGRGLNET